MNKLAEINPRCFNHCSAAEERNSQFTLGPIGHNSALSFCIIALSIGGVGIFFGSFWTSQNRISFVEVPKCSGQTAFFPGLPMRHFHQKLAVPAWRLVTEAAARDAVVPFACRGSRPCRGCDLLVLIQATCTNIFLPRKT